MYSTMLLCSRIPREAANVDTARMELQTLSRPQQQQKEFRCLRSSWLLPKQDPQKACGIHDANFAAARLEKVTGARVQETSPSAWLSVAHSCSRALARS